MPTKKKASGVLKYVSMAIQYTDAEKTLERELAKARSNGRKIFLAKLQQQADSQLERKRDKYQMTVTTGRPLWFLPGETIRKEEIINGEKLLLTDYRLLFINNATHSPLSIPINLIARADSVDLTCLRITTKLGLSLICAFNDESVCERWIETIMQADERQIPEVGFAFAFCTTLQTRIPNHPFLLDANTRLGPNFVCREYERMQFGRSWKVTEANQRFSSQMTGAVLLRCSQPRVGLMYCRNEFDEQFMSSVSRSCQKNPGLKTISGQPRMLIVDARAYRIAQLKRLFGGGSEYSAYYDEAEVCFMDMPNLHAVRVSFERLTQLYTMDSDANWFSTLEKTCWLSYISQLLKSSAGVAAALECAGRPVMVHCTDGWDRTAQLSALAQLLADPYYRTIEGFSVLVEREWLHFGHKFSDRCGQTNNNLLLDERSPIFLQWLDCVHQVRLQFPTHFEFNEQFLVKLGLHVYSGLFGTFLCNSERVRQEAQLATRTCSIWGLLSRQYNRTIVNHFYEPSKENFLEPDWRLPGLRLWNSLYRGALLPACRVSTGVIPLNKTHIHVHAEASPTNEESGMIPFEGTLTPPGSMIDTHTVDGSSCSEVEPALSLESVKPVFQMNELTIDAVASSVAPVESPCSNPLINNLDTPTNVYTVQQSTTPSTTEPLDPSESTQPSSPNLVLNGETDTGVAILPLSSINEDFNPLRSINHAHISCSSVTIPVAGNDAQRATTLPHLQSVSSYDGLLMCEPPGSHAPPSPPSRNCSFSTDGVFVADEEFDRPTRVYTSHSRASFTLDRSCNSDDEELARWTDGPVRRTTTSHHRNASSPITIGSKSDSTGCLLDRREVPLVITRPNTAGKAKREETSPNPSAEQTFQPLSSSPDGATTCSTPACSSLPIRDSVVSESFTRSDIVRSVESPSDYTMHSLPEGELLLINDTATDYEECPQYTSIISSPYHDHHPMDPLLPPIEVAVCPDYENPSSDLTEWRDAYFVPHFLVDPTRKRMSPIASQLASETNSAALSVLASADHQPTQSDPAGARPVSAPISPVSALIEASRVDGDHFSQKPVTNAISSMQSSTVVSQIGSAVTIRPPVEERLRPDSKMANDGPDSLDWDGLPSAMDEFTQSVLTREQTERCELQRRLVELTAQVASLRAQLASSTIDQENGKLSLSNGLVIRPTHIQPSGDSAGTRIDRNGLIALPELMSNGLQSDLISPPMLNGGHMLSSQIPDGPIKPTIVRTSLRRESNNSETYSFELLDPAQLNSPVPPPPCKPPPVSSLNAATALQRELCRQCVDPLCTGCESSMAFTPCQPSPLTKSRIYRPTSQHALDSPNRVQFQTDSHNGLTESSISDGTEHSLAGYHNYCPNTSLPPTPPWATVPEHVTKQNGSVLSLPFPPPPGSFSPNSVNLVPCGAVSTGHLPMQVGGMASTAVSARCRSAGSGARACTSPSTPDGVARA